MAKIHTLGVIQSVRTLIKGNDSDEVADVDAGVTEIVYRMLADHDATSLMDCEHNTDRSHAAARNIAVIGRTVDASHRSRNPHRNASASTVEDIATAAAEEMVRALNNPISYGYQVADLYAISCRDCDADIADGMSEIYL